MEGKTVMWFIYAVFIILMCVIPFTSFFKWLKQRREEKTASEKWNN